MRIDNNLIEGHIVKMRTGNPLHYDNSVKRGPGKDDVSSSFSNLLMNAIGKVNDLQVGSEKMTEQMIYDPGSVDIHKVMIAAQKSEIALSFTKAVRDEVVRAYRDLVNMR